MVAGILRLLETFLTMLGQARNHPERYASLFRPLCCRSFFCPERMEILIEGVRVMHTRHSHSHGAQYRLQLPKTAGIPAVTLEKSFRTRPVLVPMTIRLIKFILQLKNYDLALIPTLKVHVRLRTHCHFPAPRIISPDRAGG